MRLALWLAAFIVALGWVYVTHRMPPVVVPIVARRKS